MNSDKFTESRRVVVTGGFSVTLNHMFINEKVHCILTPGEVTFSFNISNFPEGLLQPESLGLVMNKSHLCEIRNPKNFLENFENSNLKNGILEFRS